MVWKYYSHSIVHLFTVLSASFALQNPFSLMSSHVFVYFVACAFGVISKRSLLRPMSRSFFPVSSRILNVLRASFCLFAYTYWRSGTSMMLSNFLFLINAFYFLEVPCVWEKSALTLGFDSSWSIHPNSGKDNFVRSKSILSSISSHGLHHLSFSLHLIYFLLVAYNCPFNLALAFLLLTEPLQ